MSLPRSQNPLSAARLRDVLTYDHSTGLFTWRIRIGRRGKVGAIAGSVTERGWLLIGVDGSQFFAHRLAWLYVHGEWPSSELDHINLDRMDNRIANLRIASDQGNSANRRANRTNRLGVKGVGSSTRRVKAAQRYRARIRVNDRLIHLGYFGTTEEASAAYAAAARKYFGEFARSV